jgi:hypothetical protein
MTREQRRTETVRAIARDEKIFMFWSSKLSAARTLRSKARGNKF